jgi:NADPH:quinone reductase-like Zn-dependent oxidoreductase
MTKVVRLHQFGGPEQLRIEDLEVGAPGPGEVLVRIEAIGLNRAEMGFRQGAYGAPPELPARMGYEAAGVLEALGPDVSGFEPGQRVSILPNFRQGQYGVYAERAIVPAHSLIPAPEGLSPVEAASVWMQYFTAMGIIEVGQAGPGDFVVVPAASSSVGLAAIQLANWAGAESVAATRTSAKAEALRAQGARHVIATQEVDVPAEVMRISGGKGARIVFDPVGGPFVETWAQAMAERGILFIYGGLSNQPTPWPHWPAAFNGLSLRGWVASEIWNKPERFERYRALILQGLSTGRLKPVIAKTFPLDQIADAHRYLESNQQIGKVVVTV